MKCLAASYTIRVFLALGMALATANSAVADEPKPPAQGAAPPGEPQPFREETIYIPYNKLREVFETEGRGVFLPYEKFQELWRAAREREAQPPAKPPVSAVINEATHVATVERDVVRVEARLELELLGAGWQKVPLRLTDAAILSATIGGAPARILPTPGQGYELLFEHKKAAAERLELKLEYAKAFTKSPGRNRVEFAPPQAPVSRWEVRINEPGVKIDLQPLVAASDVPAKEAGPNRSQLQAFVGAADRVAIDWTPRAEGAAGMEALATVQTEQQVFVEENVVRSRVQLSYIISRAELSTLLLDLPADDRVVNAFDANVRRWSVQTIPAQGDVAAHQQLRVELFEPARTKQELVVELERFASGDDQRSVAVPTVKAVGAARQQGVIAVRAAASLQAETARRTGLVQIDASELRAELRASPWTAVYRYASLPWELTLDVEKIQPRISVDSLVEATLDPQRVTLDVSALVDVRRAGIFRLEFDVPADFEVRQVRGQAVHGSTPAEVDTFRLEGTPPTRLVVNLRRQALGRIGLTWQLVKTLNEADLLAPTGRAADLAFTIPRPVGSTLEQVAGKLVFYAPESLEVNFGTLAGLRSTSFDEQAGGSIPWPAQKNGPRAVQSFAFAGEPAELKLTAERRKPHVTVRQLLVARVESGVVKYQATFFYDILYSGLKTLRIDVPAAIEPLLRVDTANVRHTTLVPPPPDLAQGDVAWSLAADHEFLGFSQIHMTWEQPLEKLAVGTSVSWKVPQLKPRLVDRAWGQIVLTKSEAIDAHEQGTPEGLRPIDPQHDLMPGASIADAAGAYEFHDAWSLPLEATRFELEEVKHTSIERAVVRMVQTRSGRVAVQALYRVRSARQRVVVKLPEGAEFDTDPLLVGGRAVPLEQASQGSYSIPLVGLDPNSAFVLELRYTLANIGSRFELPEFRDEPAAQKVYLGIYLPAELAVVRADGPWTEEIDWKLERDDWRYNLGLGLVPRPKISDRQLVDWVTDSGSLARSPFESFPTDGRLYVFSSLRPAAAPAGTLHLATVPRFPLNAAVLIGLITIGGAMVMRPPGARWWAVGLLLIGLLALAVLMPLLGFQLINGAMATGLGVLLILWWVALVRRSRRGSMPVANVPHDSTLEKPPEATVPADEPPPATEPNTAPPAEGEGHA
jgi:hypothetical protein